MASSQHSDRIGPPPGDAPSVAAAAPSGALSEPPVRNFAAVRALLHVLLAVTMVVPFAWLAVNAYTDLQQRERNAFAAAQRMTRVAGEHASNVLDVNAGIESRIVDLLGDRDDRAIEAAEREIHLRLARFGSDYPQVAAISVFGRNGKLLVNSRFFPAPPVSVADREDFIRVRDEHSTFYISRPLMGRTGGADVFTTNVARVSAQGAFRGMVSIALRRAYFDDFYRDLTGDDPTLTLAIIRKDGTPLVRYPASAEDASRKGAAAAQALTDDAASGAQRIAFSGEHEAIVSYRSLGDYPAYVSAGYPLWTVRASWRKHLSISAAGTLIPSLLVWLLIVYSLRRLRQEERIWEQWRSETVMRRSMEAAHAQARRMEALGNLVASVAHDFNNFLMAVSANMQVARRKGFDGVAEEVDNVEAALHRAEMLTRQLLGVARKRPLREERIDPASWLARRAALLQVTLGADILLDIDVRPDAWPVLADADELELALINVAMNTRDAIERDGHFSVRAENVALPPDTESAISGDFLVLTLCDDGPGMAETVRRRAFEPLFTTKRKGMGTGLGLAQVMAFCERAGGVATIASAEAQGTCVRMYLPRAAAPSLAEPAPHLPSPPSPASAAGTVAVLLVDDDDEVAEGVAALLDIIGCTTTRAPSADEALRTLATRRFDLVISDVHMPGATNGIDLAEALRRDYPEMEVILMTGYTESIDRTRLGGILILSKPFDIALVEETVQRLRARTGDPVLPHSGARAAG
jgi:signal transduction histidine kinase/ActR/RegA family two-component response regulator